MPLTQDEDKKTNKYLMSNFEPQLMDTLTQGSSAQNVLRGTESPTPPTPANPDLAPTDTGSVEENNDEKVQSSHPGHLPEDLLNSDIQSKIAQSQKYGPEEEKAVMDSLIKSRGSLGNRASRGFAGLGDAIMGVAGKSSPGFLNSLENRENLQEKMALENIPTLQKMNAEQMGAKERLEGMTSGSPIGLATSQAYQKVFKQLFPQMSETELATLTKNPSVAARIFPEMAPIIDKQVQNELKKMQIEATSSNQQSERKQEALKELEKMGITGKLMHPDIAKKLEAEAGIGGEEKSGPYGPETKRNGKTYVWSSETGKYHLKQ